VLPFLQSLILIIVSFDTMEVMMALASNSLSRGGGGGIEEEERSVTADESCLRGSERGRRKRSSLIHKTSIELLPAEVIAAVI
jgi:hypothetical protein